MQKVGKLVMTMKMNGCLMRAGLCDKNILHTPSLAERFRMMLDNNRCSYSVFAEDWTERTIGFYTYAFIEQGDGILLAEISDIM